MANGSSRVLRGAGFTSPRHRESNTDGTCRVLQRSGRGTHFSYAGAKLQADAGGRKQQHYEPVRRRHAERLIAGSSPFMVTT